MKTQNKQTETNTKRNREFGAKRSFLKRKIKSVLEIYLVIRLN